MRLTKEVRKLIGECMGRVANISLVSRVLGITRNSVYKWSKRKIHLHDRKRKAKKSKIILLVELSILALRNTFSWGTARIQQGLRHLPLFMRKKIKELGVNLVQGVSLSRTAINAILKNHYLNGYRRKKEGWKFFRAKKPNELWQLDPKGPVRIEGRKHWFVLCLDDYSRYIIQVQHYTRTPSAEEIYHNLRRKILYYKPKTILTDNNPFKDTWDQLCNKDGIESLHAHPYYPQDKGKVERNIRNIAEEFIYLLKKFPEWLEELLSYVTWFNTKRYHRGIRTIPCELFT